MWVQPNYNIGGIGLTLQDCIFRSVQVLGPRSRGSEGGDMGQRVRF